MQRLTRIIGIGYLGIIILAIVFQGTGVASFSAPVPLISAPVRPPVVVNIVYSSEKREWIKAAAERFTAQAPNVRGRPIQLVLRDQGSQALIDGIVRGQSQPTAVIPAASTQLVLLNQAWVAANAGRALIPANGANAPQPIAFTPLVAVGWSERIDRLFPQGGSGMWQRLHDAIQKPNWGDPALGGDPLWGPVKLGHTSPLKANSGIDTLLLLAYAYHGKAQDLTLADLNDSGFQQWVQEVESGVSDFPESTDALFNAFLQRGPSAYDLVVIYESQIVRRTDQLQDGRLRVIYPPATTMSDHPFVVLDAPWSTPEQQEAARMFRDFLLGEEAQQLALSYGFRPANAGVALESGVPNNPFPTALAYGIQKDLPATVGVPAPEVLVELGRFWERNVRR